MEREIIFASNNEGKVKQIKDLCGNFANIVGLKEVNLNVEIDEDGKDFEENAIKKATEIFKIVKKPVLADDSGICIDFFDGWPGVYTHRFMPNSTFLERNDFIIEKMQNVGEGLRQARNVCVLAYVDENGKCYTFEGVVHGEIAHKQRGDNLFGFDSIFVLANGKTLAELSDEEKIKVNARSLAFKKFSKFLNLKNY